MKTTRRGHGVSVGVMTSPTPKPAPSLLLLLAAAKMGWGDWEKPCLLSPGEHAALKKARLLDRRKCAEWLGRQNKAVRVVEREKSHKPRAPKLEADVFTAGQPKERRRRP